MRILATTPYPIWPANFGGARRTRALAAALARAGHDVTILAPGPVPSADPDGQVAWRSFRRGGTIAHFASPAFAVALSHLLREGFELIVAGFPYQAFMITPMAARAGVPVVYDAHNVEADRFRRLGRPGVARVVQVAERHLCRAACAVFAVSRDDQRMFRERYGIGALLLPNGVATDEFLPAPPSETLRAHYGLAGAPVVLFFGTLGYAPNREAIDYLLSTGWPAVLKRHPDARLLVVGRDPPPALDGATGVIATGSVDDIVAHLRLANVIIAPLNSGGGTRLKILEALACGQTVLSTPFGAMGIDDAEGALELAELPEFAGRLAALLDAPPCPGSNVASRALALRYEWDSLVREIDWDALARTAGEGRHRPQG